MTIRGIRSVIRTPRPNELGNAPKHFVEAARESGVHISKMLSSSHSETYIPTGSGMWRTLVAELATLPKPVLVRLSIHGTPFWSSNKSEEFSWDTYELYHKELERELGKVNPDGAGQYHVRGDARWLVEAVVQMVEDSPARCRAARVVPEGHFMLSLQIEFRDLKLLVSVYRKNSGPLALFPAVVNRQPYYI